MTTLASVQRTDARAQGTQLDYHRAVQGRDSDAWTRTMAMQMRGVDRFHNVVCVLTWRRGGEASWMT